MPKVSFAAKDAYTPSIFSEGSFEVLEANSCVYQYPPNRDTGEQYDPFLAVKLRIHRLDDNWNQTDDEPIDKIFRAEKDLSKMRPGHAKDRKDPDPEDLGDELDTLGNCFYSEEGVKINANSAWGVMMKSLEERGVKAELLADGYLPDLIGLKAHGTTEKQAVRKIQGREVEPAYFKVDRIYFDKSPSSKKPAASAKASSSSAAARSAAPAPLTNTAHTTTKPNGSTAVADNAIAEAAALALLQSLAEELAGETRELSKVYAMAYSRLMRDKTRDKSLDKAIIELLRNSDWLAAQGDGLGYTLADGSFTFEERPAA